MFFHFGAQIWPFLTWDWWFPLGQGSERGIFQSKVSTWPYSAFDRDRRRSKLCTTWTLDLQNLKMLATCNAAARRSMPQVLAASVMRGWRQTCPQQSTTHFSKSCMGLRRQDIARTQKNVCQAADPKKGGSLSKDRRKHSARTASHL